MEVEEGLDYFKNTYSVLKRKAKTNVGVSVISFFVIVIA